MKIREHREAARAVLIRFLFGALLLFAGFGVFLAGTFALQSRASRALKEDVSPLLAEESLPVPVCVQGIHPVEAQICGEYAVIVMAGQALGQTVTEEQLKELNNGRVSCPDAAGYAGLLAGALPGYAAQALERVPDKEVLRLIHGQLSEGIPVPVRLLCRDLQKADSPLRLQTALVTGLELGEGRVTLLTPFGDEAGCTVEEFLAAVRLQAEGRLPWYERLGLLGTGNAPGTVFLLSPADDLSADIL